jgi:hypothetical protein
VPWTPCMLMTLGAVADRAMQARGRRDRYGPPKGACGQRSGPYVGPAS